MLVFVLLSSQQGTKLYIKDAISLSVNCALDWFVELARVTQQWLDTGTSFDVSSIPSIDYTSARSKACSSIRICFVDFQSLFRKFGMRDDKYFMTRPAKRSPDENSGILRVTGSARIMSSLNPIVEREPLLILSVSGRSMVESASGRITLSCNISKSVLNCSKKSYKVLRFFCAIDGTSIGRKGDLYDCVTKRIEQYCYIFSQTKCVGDVCMQDQGRK